MAIERQPPDVLAMILADAVHRDLATGKNYIHGAFHGLVAASLPWTLPTMVVYVVLTDGHGQTTVRVRLVDAQETRPPIFQMETVVDFPDPLTVMEVVFPRLTWPSRKKASIACSSLPRVGSYVNIGWMWALQRILNRS